MPAFPRRPSRRTLLACAAHAALLAGCAHAPVSREAAPPARVAPFPLESVRLAPSPFLDAVVANRAYLHRLEPDRLLHNYRLYAGLAPKGAAYGGWEADTIAGHTLGHYLTACALMHAQTGDEECKRRVHYIVAELAECQAAHGDGFVAGFTRQAPDGRIEAGKRAFEEIARGDIRPAPFNLNGSWVPLYNWHKLFSGLLHADRHCRDARAIVIAERLGGYIDGVFARLSEAQLQSVLSCEHGGLNESFADLYARTHDRRWLDLARRIYHRSVLDPLADGRDELSFLHANTQIPKLAGLARLYDLAGDPRHHAAARFFWRAVTQRRSYVIGGNSDRERFQEPDSISKYITEQTCESCNTYNMMRLTRALYGAGPDAAYFDYYERAHFNHILAQQRPSDGMFAYMVPLMSGAHREFSEPFASFWCCVGTGMESHAKHGDSIYWRGDDALYVNLFIPSELSWPERRARIALETGYPYAERIVLRVAEMAAPQTFTIALRAPAWRHAHALSVNGQALALDPDPLGYFRVRRRWRSGDRVELALPMRPRIEATPDDPDTIALLHGPLVLAADLGPADQPFGAPAPALVAADVLGAIAATDARAARFRTQGAGRPADMDLSPFYALRDRRTAVYFKRYTPDQWRDAEAAFARERARIAALDARSIDVIRLGDTEDERRHDLDSDISYPVSYRFRSGRDARSGGFFEFDLAVRGAHPLVLQATYWGGERERVFHILVDGVRIATQRLHGARSGAFIDVDYAIPPRLTAGKRRIRVRFEPEAGRTAGPAFGVRIMSAA